MGAAAAVLGIAALPSAAYAQTPDATAPTITIATPADGTPSYTVGQPVVASYACTDDVGVQDCSGPVASGSAIDTSAAGDYVFTVTAHDAAGNAASLSRPYKVVAAPPTLTITLGQAGAFSPFLPGVAQSYSATTTATVRSTAANALLTVADPSAANPGHLVNGAFVLPQALKASATSSQGGASAPEAEVGDAAHPTTLLTYAGPVSGDQVTMTFRQAIGSTDPLRTGAYTKSLTFTLSTTSP